MDLDTRVPMTMRSRVSRAWIVAAVAAALVGIAGCGSSSPTPTQAAARCLQNELNWSSCRRPEGFYVSVTPTGTSRKRIPPPSKDTIQVTCIRQDGNEYICHASDQKTYDVTYDGRNMIYQQAG